MVVWQTSARADAGLALSTPEYALAGRAAEPGTLIHHADHGCQYTSTTSTTRVSRTETEASTGPAGDSSGNAPAKNPRTPVKTEDRVPPRGASDPARRVPVSRTPATP
jgi:transposase InsO family protein